MMDAIRLPAPRLPVTVTLRPRAVYAGSFDPVTLGHVSVIRRAAPLFDELHVLLAVNPEKTPMFGVEERLTFLRACCCDRPNVRVARTEGYVVDYAIEEAAAFLIRGVRDVTDAEQELQLALLNRSLAPGITTIFVAAEQAVSQVSSSGLKAMASRGEDVEKFCPTEVAVALLQRCGAREDP